MAGDQEQFQQVLSALLSHDNDIRQQAEVRLGYHIYMEILCAFIIIYMGNVFLCTLAERGWRNTRVATLK